MSQAPTLVDGAALAALADRGRDLIRSLQDASGAYPASPTFSAYRGYAWLRDGTFIADGMSAAGEVDSATAFYDWCARTMQQHADRVAAIVAGAQAGQPVPDADMLPTRFRIGGSVDDGADADADADAEWWDFQLDGYGLWIWGAAEHANRHGIHPSRWAAGIELTVDYLVSSWRRPCYDWWEEHDEQVHVSTLGSMAAGLRAVAVLSGIDARLAFRAEAACAEVTRFITEQGVRDGHLVKWVGSRDVDASLAAVVGLLDVVEASSPLGEATITEIDRQLAVAGGVHRFRADTFYGGGQWPLLSCRLGLAHARAGDTARALELLRWSASTATPNGAMPEQVTGHLLDAGFVDEWVDRWGPSAEPLLWSSAMYLRLAVELGVVVP
ncbi:hypothetical protein BH11ACT3_BH11ACT3_15290 [soil metagenome]